MCHVVSSNSYKNLPVDRWIHTTGEKRLEFVVSERRNDRSTDFSPLGFTHKLYPLFTGNVPWILGKLVVWVFWGEVLVVKCGCMKWSEVDELLYPCPWITDLTNKHTRWLGGNLSQDHLWDFHPEERKWARCQNMILEENFQKNTTKKKKKKSPVQLSVDWEVLERLT